MIEGGLVSERQIIAKLLEGCFAYGWPKQGSGPIWLQQYFVAHNLTERKM